MSLLEGVLGRRKLVLTVAAGLSLTGAALWLTMVRQEDPRLPDFWGQVVSAYPGADAETVERLVLEPIEERLAELDGVKNLVATAFDEVAVVEVELRGDTRDFREAWDEVRRALEKARRQFPEGAQPAVLDEKLQDPDAVVLAVTGSADPLALLAGARRVKEALRELPLVSRATLVADPGEQVTVELDDAAAERLGLSAEGLARQLRARNRILPGGTLAAGGKTVRLRPLSELASVEEIAATAVALPAPGTGAVPLGEVARVRMSPAEPAPARMRFDGEPAVGVAVVPRGAINLVTFGESVRGRLARLAPSLAPLRVQEVTYQPDRTAARLSELNRSLLLGVLIVAGVLVLAMGLRMGLLVASVVPLVAMSALAIFAWGGGVLHQISIAALVLALGMLVDNAIVVAENVQWQLDRGLEPGPAALAAVRGLATPLAGATATTLAAFVPMLISEGPTAGFTRSIPTVIMITLSLSYLFAVFVTPVLCQAALAPSRSPAASRVEALGRRLAAFAVKRPGRVLAIAAVLVGASAWGSTRVQQQFFPTADRNQAVVDLKLPEGSHLYATDAASRTLERALRARSEVTSVTSFLGRGAPRFYYNIPRVPFSPHFAQLIVETRSTRDLPPLIEWLRDFARTRLPATEIVARHLEQGPPVNAPVEVRLFGSDLEGLSAAAAAVSRELRATAGTRDVRSDLGPGGPTVRFRVDDAAAARYGLTRSDVAQALYGRTRGLPAGELRTGDDPIPVLVRSSRGEDLPAGDLASVSLPAPDGRFIPLAQVAREETAWRPAAIRHRDTRRVVTVSSELAEGVAFSQVLDALRPRLGALTLPAGVTLGYGGASEGAGEANASLLTALPIGLLLLLGVLLAEFHSFRKVGIILVTVPLAAAGVVPGLLIARQPFGFMSMLGVIALVGIVVNNAIVLLEVVDERLREGTPLADALGDAVARRIRPILLTSATTVAGLLPLALSSSTLWPPLASAMISGLTASTLLTLAVVPALYRLLFARTLAQRGVRPAVLPRASVAAGAACALAAVLAATPARAEEPLRLTVAEAMARAAARPAARAAEERATAADEVASAEARASLWPTLQASAALARRDRELTMSTPAGELPAGDRRIDSAAVRLVQPVFDPVRQLFGAPAARDEARARHLDAGRTRRELAASAGAACLDVLGLDARIAATRAYARNLEARLEEVRRMAEEGRVLDADVLKVLLAAEQAGQDLLALTEARRVAEAALARAVAHPGPAEPLAPPDLTQVPPPGAGAAVASALAGREDLAALRASRDAAQKRRRGVYAEALPRLDATATWTWSAGTPYAQDRWAEGALTLTWTPLASGTRAPRAAALAAQVRSLEAELQEARRGVEVEVRAALADVETARGAYRVGLRGVEQATETLRVEQHRYREGRSTVNDLLEAEARLRERQTVRDVARLDVVRAWLRLGLAEGREGPAWPAEGES